ncbi:MAG: hypothetical protein ACI8RA_002349, partial [Chlamydiales bacterium]
NFSQEIRNTSRELDRVINADNPSDEEKARLAKKVCSVALKAIGLVMVALTAVCLGNLAATLGTPIATTHLFNAIFFSVASHEAAVIGHNLYRSAESTSSNMRHNAHTFINVCRRILEGSPETVLMEEQNRALFRGTWICGIIL